MRVVKLKIWHFILFIWLIIIVFRFERVFDLLWLLINYFKFIFIDFNAALNQFSLSLFDHLFGVLIFILIPFLLVFAIRHKSIFINKDFFLSGVLLILLIFSFMFAPVITDRNPDFYKDISVTKLLPPFSKVLEIRLSKIDHIKSEDVEDFVQLKNRKIKLPFDNQIIYCDSAFIYNGQIIYYQKGLRNTFSTGLIEKQKGEYFIAKRFILGTDEFGRDIFTRLVYGTRLSLFIGFSAVIISFILGLLLGFLSGYKTGWWDLLLNRTSDMFLAFPIIFLIIFILALFGNNMISVIIVLGLSGWMSLFKLVKSEVSSIKKKDFFISSKLLGMSPFNLMKKEVLPLILAPVIVNIIFQFGNVVLAESALSFLGLGLGNEYPSWGSMIQSGQEYISHSWWMVMWPGIMLTVALLTINDLGKKLEKYFNPRIKYD